MPYILALDVSMGHSYSVLYKDDTCLFTNVPTRRTTVSSILNEFPSAKYLTIFKPLAPNMTGIPKKNENSVHF